jgi:hypothetical protein
MVAILILIPDFLNLITPYYIEVKVTNESQKYDERKHYIEARNGL